MSKAVVSVLPLLQSSFDGRPLTVLSVDGRPAWIARELGAAIGYANDGKRLVNRIRVEWAAEFLPGHDYTLVSGAALAALKGIVDTDIIAAQTPNLLVLFESGVHLALTKTTKPIGRRLRRFLVEEVLPRLVRGAPIPGSQPEPNFDMVLRGVAAVRWFRELRLARRVDLDDRKFRAGALQHCVQLLYGAGRLDDDGLLIWETRVAEIALGKLLPGLHLISTSAPPPTATLSTLPELIIASLLGVSGERVRRAVAELGLALPGDDDSFDFGLMKQVEALLVKQGFLRPRAT